MIRYRNAKLAQPLCGGLCGIFQHLRAHTHREGGRDWYKRGGRREGGSRGERMEWGEGGGHKGIPPKRHVEPQVAVVIPASLLVVPGLSAKRAANEFQNQNPVVRKSKYSLSRVL